MGVGDKDQLLEHLKESHLAIQAILDGVDLEKRVYTDSDWRVRDILGHIATWDFQVAKSLRAFKAGTEYAIPGVDGDETDFNAQAVSEQRNLSSAEILTEWKRAREDFIKALDDIPLDFFPGELLYPWGDERGSIALLVDYMVEHDQEHRDEILEAALKLSLE
jgi:hypothetical protein